MAGFKVTEDSLRTLSGDIEKVHGELQGYVGKLRGLVDSIDDGWKGQAAVAYRQLQDRWNTDQRKMSELLKDMKEAVDSTRQLYDAQEQQQNAEIAKIMSDFG